MHIGETSGDAPAFAMLDGSRPDGAVSADGRVIGTYVHGLLGSAALRGKLLAMLGAQSTGADYAGTVDAALDEIAAELEQHLDIDSLIAIAHEAGQ
jgi:adenosylcobyric acid synthase